MCLEIDFLVKYFDFRDLVLSAVFPCNMKEEQCIRSFDDCSETIVWS